MSLELHADILGSAIRLDEAIERRSEPRATALGHAPARGYRGEERAAGCLRIRSKRSRHVTAPGQGSQGPPRNSGGSAPAIEGTVDGLSSSQLSGGRGYGLAYAFAHARSGFARGQA